MSMMLMTAERPQATTVASKKAAPERCFETDAARYAWIIAEGEREIAAKPTTSRLMLYRRLAATAFGISIDELLSKSRSNDIAIPRQKIFCFLRIATGASWQQLAALFGKDHATIIHACRKYAVEIEPMLSGMANVYPCFRR
jgi:hypothetical protein